MALLILLHVDQVIIIMMMALMQLASTNLSAGFSLITPLIHRDTIYTKASRPSTSFPNWMDCDEDGSMCVDYIVSMIEPSEDFGLFYVKFYVGSLEQYAIMDTGSQLNWIECEPNNNNHVTPLYDPRLQTTTFEKLSCYTTYCRDVNGKCDIAEKCRFNQSYMGGRYSLGDLGTDVLSFENDDGVQVAVSNVVLGCSHNNTKHAGLMSGVIGLGGTQVSLAGRFRWRFSYCVGSVYDTLYPYNQLALGNGARLEGHSTPMEVDRKYYVNLLGISLGDNLLDIPYEEFKRDAYHDRGVFVDSGGELTLLTSVAYEVVYNTVYAMFPTLRRHRVRTGRLCMQGYRAVDASNFPPLTFHFSGGANLVVRSSNLFYQYPNAPLFCMTIEPSKNNKSVIGMSSQQGYNVGFDIPSKLLYFEHMDCKDLVEE